jgi:hypothetical protein
VPITKIAASTINNTESPTPNTTFVKNSLSSAPLSDILCLWPLMMVYCGYVTVTTPNSALVLCDASTLPSITISVLREPCAPAF